MKRKFFETLLHWKQSAERKPLLITGVRQVGKTHILKEFGLKEYKKFHYVNFEKSSELAAIFEKNLDPDRVLNELSFYLECSIDRKSDLIIFDEIQACPKALTSLKYFYEDLPELHICGAGSLLGVHLNPVSFPVGKVEIQKMFPMDFEEFLMAADEEGLLNLLHEFKSTKHIPDTAHSRFLEKLKHYFIVGGLPESVLIYISAPLKDFSCFQKVRQIQEQLLFAYYADIAKHSGKVNSMHIDRVFKSIPSQLEKATDESVSKFKIRGVVSGVSHYQRLAGVIDWLESAGLIHKISIAHSAQIPLKNFTKESVFKLFVFDVGMLGCMMNLSASTILNYDYGTYKGYFAENYVVQELTAQYQKKLYSWTENKSELEFLQEVNGKIVPIEVKSGRVIHSKSLKRYEQKYQPDRQVIFSSLNFKVNSAQNLFYLPLYSVSVFTDLIALV